MTALGESGVAIKALVCGLHRSGTSAMAHHLAAGAGWRLLDDPEWAIEEGAESFLEDPASHAELAVFESAAATHARLSEQALARLARSDAAA